MTDYFFMFQVKLMRIDDFQFATQLANTMNWNMAPEDFAYASKLEPQGCFVAFDAAEPVGVATSISFGKVGWFGNLIVKENCRNKGAGSLLVKHALDYLHSKRVKTIGLYAYPNLVDFYSHLGFKYNEDFSVLSIETLASSTFHTPLKVGTQKIKAIEKFDCQCFGGDRKKLLQSIILKEGNLCGYESYDEEILGYVAATVYEKMAWVGPLMCRANHVKDATSLVKAALGNLGRLSVYAALPKKEEALMNLFFDEGFKEDFFVSRMFLGQPATSNCIYMAESLERG